MEFQVSHWFIYMAVTIWTYLISQNTIWTSYIIGKSEKIIYIQMGWIKVCSKEF